MKSRLVRVCLIAPLSGYDAHSPSALYVSALANGLAERGSTVHILTTPLSDTPSNNILPANNANIIIHQLPHTASDCSTARFIRAARKAYRQLHNEIDLVHCVNIASNDIITDNKPGLTTLLTPRLTASDTGFLSFLRNKYNRNFYRIISRSDILITLSASLRQYIKQRCHNRQVHYIPGGYTPHISTPQPMDKSINNTVSDTTNILSIMPDYYPQNWKCIIDAWRLIPVQKASLTIWCSRRYIRLIHRFAHKAPLPPNRIIVEYIDTQSKVDFLSIADAAIVYPKYPFDWTGEIPRLLSAGIPIIGIQQGATAELVGDAGILCIPDNPTDISHGIQHLLGDAQTRCFLQYKAQNRGKHFFSTENMIKQTLALYWNTLKHTRRNSVRRTDLRKGTL